MTEHKGDMFPSDVPDVVEKNYKDEYTRNLNNHRTLKADWLIKHGYWELSNGLVTKKWKEFTNSNGYKCQFKGQQNAAGQPWGIVKVVTRHGYLFEGQWSKLGFKDGFNVAYTGGAYI